MPAENLADPDAAAGSAAGNATRPPGSVDASLAAGALSLERLQLLESVLDAPELGIGVLELLPDGFQFAFLNRTAAAFYGLEPGASDLVAGRDVPADPETVRRWTELLHAISASGRARTLEYASAARPGRWYLATYSPLAAGRSGRPRVAFVAIDVTDRRVAEERQKLLAREVDHRARNALAVAQAVVQLTPAAEPAAFKSAVSGRVTAIARAHDLLAAQRWSGVDLRRLILEELGPYVPSRGERIRLYGPACVLAPITAQSLGLIFHELATNASRHGALSGEEGRVEVEWTVQPERFRVTWTETSGAETASPRAGGARGFGLRLLERTVRDQLGGGWEADWRTAGPVFVLDLPPEVALAPTEAPIFQAAAAASAAALPRA